MPYVQLDGLQYPLEPGRTPVGSGPEARVRLRGISRDGVFALIDMADDGSVIVRRSGDAAVLVNGLDIGDQPSPLIHGDKLEVLGRELFYGDDRRAGSTQYVPSMKAEGSTPRPGGGRTAATGGRLVSLVDGREYAVPETGLVIGRDPTCDVVVPSTEVSRRHASITPAPNGYLLSDTSTNGVLVNSSRLEGSQLLGRGDVLRIGEEEFRFYADSAPPSRPLLATLEATGSSLSGRRFEIRTVLAHVGRGEHNDIVLPDDSVSDSHAKFQRREGEGWVVVDLDSTNGTYVSGRRIAGSASLDVSADLRFGGVKLRFQPAEQDAAGAKGTRVIAPRSATPSSPHRTSTPTHIPAVRGPVRPAPTREQGGIPAIVWILLSGLLAIVAFIFLTSR